MNRPSIWDYLPQPEKDRIPPQNREDRQVFTGYWIFYNRISRCYLDNIRSAGPHRGEPPKLITSIFSMKMEKITPYRLALL